MVRAADDHVKPLRVDDPPRWRFPIHESGAMMGRLFSRRVESGSGGGS